MTDTSSRPSETQGRWFQFSLSSLLILVTLAAALLVAWRGYVEMETKLRVALFVLMPLFSKFAVVLALAVALRNCVRSIRAGRRIKYSLRPVWVVVTLVAGFFIAWQACFEPYRRQLETMAWIKDLDGSYTTEQGGPSWLRGLFGDHNFQNIITIQLSDREISDEDLAHLEGLAKLEELWLAAR